jgi:hypothetical protein
MKLHHMLPSEGYLGIEPKKETFQYMIIDDSVEKIHNVVVKSFLISDVDDPIMYAAEPLYEWENSEVGQWVKKHSIETPMWHRMQEAYTYSHKFCITAKLRSRDLTYFLLKWGHEGTPKN